MSGPLELPFPVKPRVEALFQSRGATGAGARPQRTAAAAREGPRGRPIGPRTPRRGCHAAAQGAARAGWGRLGSRWPSAAAARGACSALMPASLAMPPGPPARTAPPPEANPGLQLRLRPAVAPPVAPVLADTCTTVLHLVNIIGTHTARSGKLPAISTINSVAQGTAGQCACAAVCSPLTALSTVQKDVYFGDDEMRDTWGHWPRAYARWR